MQPQPWIKPRCKELGKTLKGLGEAMGGLDGSRITEIIAGTRRVDAQEVQPMADYLQLSYEVVYGRLFGSVPSIGGDVKNAQRAAIAQPDELRVFAARDLGGGIVELSDEPALRIPSFTSTTAADAFACYVVTEHMSPAYEIGDCLLINPVQPAAPGNDVLLISGGAGELRKGALRHLVSFTETHWVVKQLNPPKSEKFDRKTWHTAYKVGAVQRR